MNVDDLSEFVRGERLVAVVFVQDYFQVRSDFVGINFFAHPVYRRGDASAVSFHDPEFAVLARSLIGREMRALLRDGDDVSLVFADGSALCVRVGEGGLPEAMEISGGDKILVIR